MKKTIVILIIGLMLFSIFVIADEGEIVGTSVHQQESTLYYPVGFDGTKSIESYTPLEMLWYAIFPNEALAFVSMNGANCVSGWQVSIPVYRSYGGYSDSAKTIPIASGSACPVGEYIMFYKCLSNDCSMSSKIFAQLWYRSSSSDLLQFRETYMKDSTFQYTYNCWKCNVPIPSTTTTTKPTTTTTTTTTRPPTTTTTTIKVTTTTVPPTTTLPPTTTTTFTAVTCYYCEDGVVKSNSKIFDICDETIGLYSTPPNCEIDCGIEKITDTNCLKSNLPIIIIFIIGLGALIYVIWFYKPKKTKKKR